MGEKDIDATMTEGRGEVQDKVKANLQKLLNTYNTGLVVTQVGLQEVDAPTQVREAFHDVVRAWEDRDRLIQEAQGVRADVIPRAGGQAQQEILEAEAFKAQRVIRARGDAQRFNNIFAEYAKSPKVTRERLYLESVEQFLPATKKFIMEGGSSSCCHCFRSGSRRGALLLAPRNKNHIRQPTRKGGKELWSDSALL